jgi:hypothetical protein
MTMRLVVFLASVALVATGCHSPAEVGVDHSSWTTACDQFI